MDKLPLELLYNILNNLNIKEIIILASTNKKLYKRIRSSNYFWRKYYLSYFDNNIKSLYIDRIIDWNFILDYGQYILTSNIYIHKQYFRYKHIIDQLDKNIIFTDIKLGYYVYPSANFTGSIIHTNNNCDIFLNGIIDKCFIYNDIFKLILNILLHRRIDFIQIKRGYNILLHLFN